MECVKTLVAALVLLTSASVNVWAKDVNAAKHENQFSPFVTPSNNIADEKNQNGKVQAIDLALPSGTKWANMNVGASRPEDYGSYFQWGETTSVKGYNDDGWNNNYTPGGNIFHGGEYNDCGTDADPMWTDGTIKRADGFWNGDIAGSPKYDAATANLGKQWKTPNIDQIHELLNPSNCIWTWTTQNGIDGYLITSVRNGNKIFIPAAGSFSSPGNFGSYWSSTLYLQGAGEAYTMAIYPAEYNTEFSIRCCGQSVRPVMKGVASNEVITNGNSNTSADNQETESDSTAAKAIELGLPSGTKWANKNIGASSPEECGYYFQWGETTPVRSGEQCDFNSDYTPGGSTIGDMGDDWDDAKDPMYNDGTVSQKDDIYKGDIAGNSKYDAARECWGVKWSIPTIDQIEELVDSTNCSWVFTTLNGVHGYQVTSVRNGNSIFLPAAGFGEDMKNAEGGTLGTNGNYWSSTINQDYPYDANTLAFGPDYIDADWRPRYMPISIRPVSGGIKIEKRISIEDGKPKDIYSDNAIGFPDGADFVDLELPSGLCWANMNLGATKPEESGCYFQWGETTPTLPNDDTAFNEHYTPGGTTFQGQSVEDCGTNNDPMFADGTIFLGSRDEWKGDIKGTKYDAATVNWGTGWEIPNKAQIRELLDNSNCKWEWTTRNGVEGYKVISVRNGNSIFLPAAGCRSGVTSVSSGVGYYWVSEIYPYTEAQYFGTYPSKAYALKFNAYYDRTDLYQEHRCKAFCIRPVIFPAK
jgi:hypothetical protein